MDRYKIPLTLLLFLTACSSPKPAAPETPPWYRPDPATTGVVAGRVLFSGKRPPAKVVNMDNDPLCARQHQEPMREEVVAASRGTEGETLANVFVYIRQGLEERRFEPPAAPAVIEQRGCWFGPRVLGVQVGQTLQVVNADPLTHNIHPLAQVNREWNQSQAPGEPPFTRRFSQPEVMIRVKCNIHNWMHAWVGVVAHPYFAVTGADGAFQLAQVPPGSYTIEAWHEQLGRQEQQITLAPSGKNEIVFKFKGE